jgi:hypothetical protein
MAQSALRTLSAEEMANPDIRRVTPDTSPKFLQELARNESVHAFRGGITDLDMRTRLGFTPESRGRRAVYYWQDSQDPDGAYVSIQVAWAKILPGNVQQLIAAKDEVAGKPDTAVFYSISNWRRARAVAERFINALVEKISAEEGLDRYATLSPMPEFRKWVAARLDQGILASVGIRTPVDEFKNRALAAASYTALDAATRDGLQRLVPVHVLGGDIINGQPVPFDRNVAGFHQGRGAVAVAARSFPEGNAAPRGQDESWGMMINYLNVGSAPDNAASYKKGQPVIHDDFVAPIRASGRPGLPALWRAKADLA